MAVATQKGIGLTPNMPAADKAIGRQNAAAALFVISSVIMLVVIYTSARIMRGESVPLSEIMATERHPLLGLTIEELYNALKANAQKI